MVGNDILVKAESKYDGQFFMEVPSDQIMGQKTKVVIEVLKEGKVIQKVKTGFLGPIYR
jgi:hypothetical protein